MSNTEPRLETFYDNTTGKTIVRELTQDELDALSEAPDETPSPD